MVELTVFEVGVKVTKPAKELPDVKDTSYPVGAVTVMSETRFVPETVKFCSAEAKPLQVVKVFRVPEVEIVGVKTVAVTAVLLAEIHPVVVFLACA